MVMVSKLASSSSLGGLEWILVRGLLRGLCTLETLIIMALGGVCFGMRGEGRKLDLGQDLTFRQSALQGHLVHILAMLSIRRLATSSDALRSYGASKPVPAAKKSLQRTVMKKYSTVRRRVVNASSSSKPSSYATEDALMTEKTKQELDREFDETFFRKPKVLIIGTDVAAMTAGTSSGILLFLAQLSSSTIN